MRCNFRASYMMSTPFDPANQTHHQLTEASKWYRRHRNPTKATAAKGAVWSRSKATPVADTSPYVPLCAYPQCKSTQWTLSAGPPTLAMSNAKQTRVCGNRMCGQAFVAGPRYKASWCGPCKNWLALYGDIRNPNGGNRNGEQYDHHYEMRQTIFCQQRTQMMEQSAAAMILHNRMRGSGYCHGHCAILAVIPPERQSLTCCRSHHGERPRD